MRLGLPSGRFRSLCPASSVRPNLATDFSTICFSAAQHSSSPLVPVSLCPPFPSFSPLFTHLHWFTQRALIRSFVRSKTDRPSRTVGIWQMAKLQIPHLLRLVFFTIFFLRLPLFDAVYPAPKPNLSGASSQDDSTLLSTRSRRVGRSSVDSSGCLGESSEPASFLQQTFTDNRTLDNIDGAEDTGHDNLGSHTHSTSPARTILA